MLKLLFTCFTFFTVINISAQNSQIAIIKYQDAEEYFNKNEFKKTISSLNECEKLLGTTNAKIMFLKINAQVKLIEIDPLADYELIKSVRLNVQKYIKEYETIPNNQEKYKVIYTMMETLNQYPQTIEAFEMDKKEIAAANKIKLESEQKKIASIEFVKSLAEKYKFKPGLTESEFKEYNPESKKLIKWTYKSQFSPNTYESSDISFLISNITRISFQDDKIKEYTYLLGRFKNDKSSALNYFNQFMDFIYKNVDNKYLYNRVKESENFYMFFVSIPDLNFFFTVVKKCTYNNKWDYIDIEFTSYN